MTGVAIDRDIKQRQLEMRLASSRVVHQSLASMNHVLIVEDDADSAQMMAALIETMGPYTVATAGSLREARLQIGQQRPDLVLLDLQLPDGNGMTLFDNPEFSVNVQVVLITGHATLETSIQALRLGAADYLIKPVGAVQLEGVMSRLMKPDALQAELSAMTDALEREGHFGALWGRSDAMRRIYAQLARVSGTAATVFITGESGTGKEVVAQTVHGLSRRRHCPFLAVNCGAVSPNLMESEIFGHEKGSFTGAERLHQGFFERAHGGTLFLDEITEMPQELQVKLLRVLESGSFSRVGSTESRHADVRIIAATNREPLEAVARGRLREDLLYRLNVFPVDLPPLRERATDIALLAQYFLNDIARREGEVKKFSPEALARLGAYRWPGNVRELRNVVQRVYVMTPGPVISDEWLPRNPDTNDAPDTEISVKVGTSMAEAERKLILATMQHFDNHKERTAAALGVSLKTLYNRLKAYAEEDDEAPGESADSAREISSR